MGLLHTGTSYADDLFADGVLYHYPSTGRPQGRDDGEVKATKAAARLQLPVFVVAKPSPTSSVRDVHLGWVEGWDDGSRTFLVCFAEDPPAELISETDEAAPFKLVDEPRTKQITTKVRTGQQRFKLQVFRYYGACCAVCNVVVADLLDAAHIRPKRDQGSDDPRNGLVLCATHHRAFDAGLFGVRPKTLEVLALHSLPTVEQLGLTRENLAHLARKPHSEALAWAREQHSKK